MGNYRKKPVNVDAFRFGVDGFPDWFLGKVADGTISVHTRSGENKGLFVSIRTLEGTMRGELGDYLIKGVQGEIYPCKADIFEATYEKYLEGE